jgi:N-hydroxyarylamine O-acetyltransferase
MDPSAYLARIGYDGPRAATREVLAELVARHVAAIPFENLDVLLRRPIGLDEAALVDKLVHARRGGYCFEHATLMAAALRALGFDVATHSARVVLVTPPERSPRTHMFLTAGDVLLDPGFGRGAAPVPVPLDGTPAAGYRLVRDGEWRALEFEGQRLWVSTFEHDVPIDFVLANHYTSTYPESHFVNHLMLSAATPDGRVSVMDRDVTEVARGETRTWQLADRAALRALIARHFGFDLPGIERLVVNAIPAWR